MSERMTTEEIRIRSVYLFLSCSQVLEQFAARLAAMVPAASPSVQRRLDRSLKKELALLFRYWSTRQIWQRLESSGADARDLNLAVLRLFTDAFKLPQDGSGIRYAELSTLAEEVHELSQRLTYALGAEPEPLLDALQAGILPWREAVTRHTTDALSLPLEQLASAVKAWAEQAPRTSR